MRQTAKPIDPQQSHLSTCPTPPQATRQSMSLEIERNFGIIQALPSPMPGSNMPLDDPFDDAAAALFRSEHSATKASTRESCLSKHHLSDKHNKAAMDELRTTPDAQMGVSSTQVTYDSSPENDVSKQSAITSRNSDQSTNNSPSPCPRTLRRTKVIPLIPNEQSSIPKSQSESQHGANMENSDCLDAKPESTKGTTITLQQPDESYETRLSEDCEFGADLFRCKTLAETRSAVRGRVPILTFNKPSSDETDLDLSSLSAASNAAIHYADDGKKALTDRDTLSVPHVLETGKQQARLPSSHGLATNRQTTLVVPRCSELEITPFQVGAQLPLLQRTSSQARILATQQPSPANPQKMKGTGIGKPIEIEHHQVDASTRDKRTPARPVISSKISQVTSLPHLTMPARQQSSDDSQDTNDTMSSTAPSSATSSSAVSGSNSAGSQAESLEHQHFSAA